MNKYDVAGILQTYAYKVISAKDTEKLKVLIKELKKELDLRKIEKEK